MTPLRLPSEQGRVEKTRAKRHEQTQYWIFDGRGDRDETHRTMRYWHCTEDYLGGGELIIEDNFYRRLVSCLLPSNVRSRLLLPWRAGTPLQHLTIIEETYPSRCSNLRNELFTTYYHNFDTSSLVTAFLCKLLQTHSVTWLFWSVPLSYWNCFTVAPEPHQLWTRRSQLLIHSVADTQLMLLRYAKHHHLRALLIVPSSATTWGTTSRRKYGQFKELVGWREFDGTLLTILLTENVMKKFWHRRESKL